MQPDQARVELFITSRLTAHMLVFRYRFSLAVQEIPALVVNVNVMGIRGGITISW